jgi:2-dehydropantoate 2-reductase
MGCLFAARLSKAGHDVTLLDYRQERADFINRNGVSLKGLSGDFKLRIPTTTRKVSDMPDVVLLCVKANQTRTAAQNLEPWLGHGATVLTLQNGLGNVETLKGILGDERVIGGVTAEGATLLGPGQARHAGQGQTVIGAEGIAGRAASDIVSAFDAAGFDTRSSDNVNDLIWGKLIVNVGINALTAITRLRNGLLPTVEGTRMVMEMAVSEAVAVATAKGINLPYPDPLERVMGVCEATASNVASMLQDVLNHRMTEIAFINGAVVREAKAFNIPTPVNHTLTCLVQAIQETYQERLDS